MFLLCPPHTFIVKFFVILTMIIVHGTRCGKVRYSYTYIMITWYNASNDMWILSMQVMKYGHFITPVSIKLFIFCQLIETEWRMNASWMCHKTKSRPSLVQKMTCRLLGAELSCELKRVYHWLYHVKDIHDYIHIGKIICSRRTGCPLRWIRS